MVSDILVLVGAILVPLALRPRWLVVVLCLACAAAACAVNWQVGLQEDVDVPPVMLAFSTAVLMPVAVGVALAVHALKNWCLQRWQARRGAERK